MFSLGWACKQTFADCITGGTPINTQSSQYTQSSQSVPPTQRLQAAEGIKNKKTRIFQVASACKKKTYDKLIDTHIC